MSDFDPAAKVFAGGAPGQQAVPMQNQPENQAAEMNPQNENVEEMPDFSKGDVYIFQQEQANGPVNRFDKEVLRGGQPGSVSNRNDSRNNFSDDINWDNRKFSAEDLGGVSLSTYAWDFAPYILAMKRRLREHIYPPPAFMQMGAITGEVMLRFRVHPDGSVTDLVLIDNKGHSAFIETSMNAVKASNPFRPLPDTFPDPYLDLTWTFIYTITR